MTFIIGERGVYPAKNKKIKKNELNNSSKRYMNVKRIKTILETYKIYSAKVTLNSPGGIVISN